MKKLLIALSILILLGGGAAAYVVMGSYSNGFQAGTVTQFSNKGYVFKTHEGQLKVDLPSAENPADTLLLSSDTWNFSVCNEDKKVADVIDDALLNNKRIKLYYEEKFIQLPWRGDTKYFVYKAEILP